MAKSKKKKSGKKSGSSSKKKSSDKKSSKKKSKKAARRKAARKKAAEEGLPLREIRARLGMVQAQFAEASWLEGIYLYGASTIDEPKLKHVKFLVVHDGLRDARQKRVAKKKLTELLDAVLDPIGFDLQFTEAGRVGRLLDEENPAAQAVLGYAEAVYPQ